MPLEVIGAGFGRTGTETLQTALEILGMGPCYHMSEVLKYPGDERRWLAIADAVDADQSQVTADDDHPKISLETQSRIRDLFEGCHDQSTRAYRAAVDFPASSFYRQLLATYPRAKVILTVRDSPAAWYQSARDTIWHVYDVRQFHPDRPWSLWYLAVQLNPWLRASCVFLRRTIWDRVFQGRFADAEYAQKVYVDWVEEVRRVVPSGQLLVYNVKEGWEPLCAFLGKPVPDVAFPRSNDRGKFGKDWWKRFQTRVWRTVAGYAAALTVGGTGLLLAILAVRRRLRH